MKRLKIKSYYIIAIIISIFVYFHKEMFYTLKQVACFDVKLLIILSLFANFINACQLKYLAEIFHIKLKFREWFGLTVANTMHNYYTPARGGMLLKAFYLKKSHDLQYSNFISLTAGAYLIGFFLASVSAVFFIILSFFLYQEFNKAVFFISIGLVTATVLLGFFSLYVRFSAVFKKIPRLYNFVLNVENGLLFFKKNRRLLIKILLLKFIFIVIMATKLYWAFKAIGVETNLLNILIVQSLVVFSMVLSLTPGNLGVREGIIGLLASMLGIPLKEAVLGAIVDRVVMMCVVIFLGLIFTKILVSDLERQTSTTGKDEIDQMESKLL